MEIKKTSLSPIWETFLKVTQNKDLLNRPDLSGFPEYEKIEKEGFFCSKGKWWGWLVVVPLLFTK
jgi:hypothetical protein